MSREALLEARDLIKAKRYDEARFILKSIDHPTAKEWLAKLDQIAPPPKLEANDNPFDSPFDDPFAKPVDDNPFAAKPTPRQTPPPRPPQPAPQQVWISDQSFGKPAKPKSKEPQISDGMMILAVGAMLVVMAFCLGIVYVVFGDRDADKKESSAATSIFSFDNESVFNITLENRGELVYGAVQDDYVANDTGHIWTFQGTAGDRVDIAIESQWDNVLQLQDANGNLIRENDDQDGGEFAGDARLYDIRLPSTGMYQIVVKPWGFIGGTYRLWLSKLQ